MQSLNDTAAKKQYALPGNFDLPLRPKSSLVLCLQRWYRRSLLRVLVTECCNLGHRIRRIQEIHEVELGRGKEEVHQWRTSCAVGGPYTRDYIAYMQRIEAEHPFLSTLDMLLLSHAWKAGLESGGWKDIPRNQDNIRS